MFITVRYGADNHKLFNPDCSLRLMVDSIRKGCLCPEHAAIALIDDKFKIIELPEDSMENATSLFTDRAIYILLAVEKRDHAPTKYSSLLEDIDSELAAELEKISNPRASDPKVQALRGGLMKNKKGPKVPVSKSKRLNSSSSKLKGKS